MSKFRVLMTDCVWPEQTIERQLLDAAQAELVVAPAKDEATLAALAADVEGILTCWAPVTRAVIAAAPRLRIVSRMGIGLDNIDVDAASERKVMVTNVPNYCLEEVAEHALALLLALARNIAGFYHAAQQGRYDRQAGPPLRRLSRQTLGIIGLGNIGRAVAHKALGLGLRVLAHGRGRQPAVAGVAWRPLEALLAESDYVSLHVPGGPDTRHLLGMTELRMMKPSAFLINTARGSVVDPQALAEALAEGRLAGAALDVQHEEPPNLAEPPYNDPRVIVTPHVAFASEESLAELRHRATMQLIEGLLGHTPPHVVNPIVLS